MNCPLCNAECIRDVVDNGIGEEYSPWSCPNCGWYQGDEIDKLFKEEYKIC